MSAEQIALFDEFPILGSCCNIEGDIFRVPNTKYLIQLRNPLHEIGFKPNNLVLVVTGPPGGGKDSLVDRLSKHDGIPFSRIITATTRKPRDHELEDDPYIRMSTDAFLKGIDDGIFLEYIEHVSDGEPHYYGTLKSEVLKALEGNQIPIFRIDPRGATKMQQIWIAQDFSPDTVLVHCHIAPPSHNEIIRRLYQRAVQDGKSTEVIRKEIMTRIPQIIADLSLMKYAHYVLINQNGQQNVVAEELVTLFQSLMSQ